MGTAWFCLVTAEMIAGQYGIGYYTWESYNLQRYPDIVVGMLFIGLFGMASSCAGQASCGARLTPWYRLEGARHDDGCDRADERRSEGGQRAARHRRASGV